MKRNVLNSPGLLKLKRHKRRIVWNKIFLSFIALSVIFASLSYLSRLERINIKEVEISAQKTIDTEAIQKIIESQLGEKYLWLFPKTNIFFYPKNTIKNELQNEFKKLKDISFSIKNNQVLLVSLTDREAKYTWCGENPSDEEEKCYFVDEGGYIFDEAPFFSGAVYFKFYGPAHVGSYFSKENFQQLASLKDVLTAIKLKPVSLHILESGDVKIFLAASSKTSIEPYIIFKNSTDFQNVVENLETALTTEPLQSNLKNKYSSFLYIDLRFGNKVLYKFQ